MRITSKLALSQIKINRNRSIGTVAGITLANALIVTICSFVASANSVVTGLVGDGYGQYRATYMMMVLLPAIFFIGLIAAMTKTVIANFFKVSAMQRMNEFGILKCVGTTSKQIREIVLYESVMLSAVGIPIGAILGVGLAFVATQVANLFLDEINALVHVMMTEITLHMVFVFSPMALVIASLICFLIVLYAAYQPAKQASKISAIESIRGTQFIQMNKKKVRFVGLIHKLFGFEGELAHKNMSRNSTTFKATLTALTLGVILFVGLAGISSQAEGMMEHTKLPYEQSMIVDYVSARIYQENEVTGARESVYIKPIASALGHEIGEKLSAFEGLEVFGEGRDGETYKSVLPSNHIEAQMISLLDEPVPEDDMSTHHEVQNYHLETIISTLDPINYKKLCDVLGVPVGSNILINDYTYNANGVEKSIVPYDVNIKEITLEKADGSTQVMQVDAMLYKENIPTELDYINKSPIRLIVPEAEVRSYSWYVTPQDEEAFKAYAGEVLEMYFPQEADGDYMEEGFSTRVYRVDEYSKVMNVAIILLLVLMGVFACLVMLIGFTNIASTLMSNVLMRADEFAVLQSIGMTKQGIAKMLMFESLLCSGKALWRGIVIAVSATYLINIPIKAAYPIPFEFPFMTIVVCIIGVLSINLGITSYAINVLSRKNIIETIRLKGQR